MPQHFVCADRDQAFLMPPSLREWLPEDHLAWFVLDAVAEMDLAAFYADYRADGHGRPAHDPALMVGLVLYAYAVGERSLRKIERRCIEDVAFRVIAGNATPGMRPRRAGASRAARRASATCRAIRPGGAISPIPTRGRSRGRADFCRATTPTPSPPKIRSSSPPS